MTYDLLKGLRGVVLGFGVATLIIGRLNERSFRYMAATVIVAGGLVLLGRKLARL